MLNPQDARMLARGLARWLIRMGVGLNIILWLMILQVYCQNTHDSQHTNRADLEDDIRVKTITFLNIEKDTLYFKREGRYGIDLGSFVFDADTQWDRNKPLQGCYIAIYCVSHHYLYILYPCRR
jgi:hypothetical protein